MVVVKIMFPIRLFLKQRVPSRPWLPWNMFLKTTLNPLRRVIIVSFKMVSILRRDWQLDGKNRPALGRAGGCDDTMVIFDDAVTQG